MPIRLSVACGALVVAAIACTPEGHPVATPSPLVSPSASALRVEGVRLVPVRPEVAEFCSVAARELGLTIACPTVLPSRPLFRGTELCTGTDDRLGGRGCFRGGAFIIQETFEGPLSYEGILASDGSSNIGHLNVWASPSGAIDEAGVGCSEHGRIEGMTRVAGREASWILCPEDATPAQDSGHVVLEWVVGAVTYAVSLHTDTDANRAIALTIAERLTMVAP